MGPTGWVVLRDYHELTGYDVKEVRKAITKPGTGTATVEMQEKTIELMVKNWSRSDLLLPATPGVTDRLTAAEFSSLLKAVEPAFKLMMGLGVAPVMSQAALADQASPTGPSSE